MKKTPEDADVEMGRRIRLAQLFLAHAAQLAGEACGITFQQIQKYEKGTNRVGFSRMGQIAEALDMSVHELIGEAGGTAGAGPVDALMGKATIADMDAMHRYFELVPEARKLVRQHIELLGRHIALAPQLEAAE